MKNMTAKIVQRYFRFSPDIGSDFYALIAAKDKKEAVKYYYENISDIDAEPDAKCKELTSSQAWEICRYADDVEDIDGSFGIEDKLEEFEGPGIILWPGELIQ